VGISRNGFKELEIEFDLHWMAGDAEIFKLAADHCDLGFFFAGKMLRIEPTDDTVGGDDMVRLWDVKTGRLLAVLEGHQGSSYGVAYNADGTHQAWVEATANSIKNTLGIDASATPLPTFKQIRDQVHSKTIGKAFRYGWQGDYPSMLEFLTSQYQTGSETNDVGYSDPEFDNLLVQAQSAATPEDSYKVITQAQAVLFRDMADIPVLDYKGTGGYSENVKSAKLAWSGLFDFENIEKN